MRQPRLAVLAFGALLTLAGAASPARAESALWTLVATPLTVSTGSLTTFSLAATNEDPLALLSSDAEIGCVRVTLPDLFDVRGAAVVSATTGATWSASISGQTVTVRTSSGGDRFAVRFTITAMPLSAGELAWGARAYRDQGCGGSGALLGVPPVVLVTGAAATPTPAPTPAPTPQATPAATIAPTPVPRPPTSAPPATPPPAPTTPRPSVSAAPSLPGAPGASPSDGATPRPAGGPTASQAPGATEQADGAVPGGPSPGTPGMVGAGAPGLDNSGRPGAGESGNGSPPGAPGGSTRAEGVPLSLGPLGLLGTIDVWIVPGLLYGVPGVLLLLFVLAQAGGAAAWLPAIRRLRGHEEGSSEPA